MLVTIAVAAGVPSALVLHRAIERCDAEGRRVADIIVPTSLFLGLIWLPGWAAIAYVLGEMPLAPILIPVTAPLTVLLGAVLVRSARYELPSGEYSYNWFSYQSAGGAVALAAYLPQFALLLAEHG